MIKELKMAHPNFSISELCEVYGLSRSTYYDGAKAKVLSSQKYQMLKIIKQAAIESGHTYGKRRMNKELKNAGFSIGVHKTANLMKQANIVAIRPKKRHYYPNEGTSNKKVENVLNREFDQAQIGTHWVTDITYIRNHQCWSYLAAVLDLGSKEIVGWALSKKPDTQLAKNALENAIKRKAPKTSKLLVHSDQGTQYTSNMFDVYCNKFKITRSMSRRGNCWDNAVMERFFRNLKTERLNHLSFLNHQAVVAEVESYIYFYNYKRWNSAIDYMTPNQRFKQLAKIA